MRSRSGRGWGKFGALAVAVTVATAPAVQAGGVVASQSDRDVMSVGNNWDGTVDLIDAKSFNKYQRIDVVPDLEQRMAAMSPDEHIAFLVVRESAGEGNDQLVDDIAVSPEGHTMYVSRPSLGDVSAFDIETGEQVWRTDVFGYRSDHMALSPDGSRLVVSATTANEVNAIDPANGEITGSFSTGDFPHENRFSEDGQTLYNATIGRVIAPDAPALDAGKGERVLTIADAETMEVRDVIDFGVGIRPFRIMPD